MYLVEHKLLVTQNDKNLGSVVMSVEWYHQNCRKFLDNNKDVFITSIPSTMAKNLNYDNLKDIDALVPMI